MASVFDHSPCIFLSAPLWWEHRRSFHLTVCPQVRLCCSLWLTLSGGESAGTTTTSSHCSCPGAAAPCPCPRSRTPSRSWPGAQDRTCRDSWALPATRGRRSSSAAWCWGAAMSGYEHNTMGPANDMVGVGGGGWASKGRRAVEQNREYSDHHKAVQRRG